MKAKPSRGFMLVLGVALSGIAPEMARGQVEASGLETSLPRRPVLLVPGWLGRREDMVPLEQRFIRDGWSEEEVLPLEFNDPVGSSVDHADELEVALEGLLARTGAEGVDIVAHSMGSLAVWVHLQKKGNPLGIRRVVFLAAPFQGTLTAHLAWGEGGREMIPGSGFLESLKKGPQPQLWVDVLTVRTPLDLTVVPWEGSTLLESRDRMICCPTHQGLLDHEGTFVLIRDFLMYGWRGVGSGGGP